ncbi:MAG: glutathione S-transferase [Polyangiaceae bacterium]|nr:glutathione S-transferase [Polyangiaceae bacterium]
MKLYYAPGACSLADHIALLEVGVPFDTERVDLKTKTTASGADFKTVNPKGYVPALVLDDGEVITENIAVLDWIAARCPPLGVAGALGRTRMLEALAFISTEIHRAFKPLWHGGSDDEKAKARTTIAALFRHLAERPRSDFLLGTQMSVADCYLFVMLRWAARFGVEVPEPLRALQSRMESRPSVQRALQIESAG